MCPESRLVPLSIVNGQCGTRHCIDYGQYGPMALIPMKFSFSITVRVEIRGKRQNMETGPLAQVGSALFLQFPLLS